MPRPPLDGLIDDLSYLEGAPPYPRLTLPPMPGAVLIVNLGAPFRIRAGTDIVAADFADGVVITTPTRAMEFSYPPGTRSVGVHFKAWGWRRSCRCPRPSSRSGARQDTRAERRHSNIVRRAISALLRARVLAAHSIAAAVDRTQSRPADRQRFGR